MWSERTQGHGPDEAWILLLNYQHNSNGSYLWNGRRLPNLPAGAYAEVEVIKDTMLVHLVTRSGDVTLSEPANEFPSPTMLAQIALIT
jgi:hypothetical protein